jgi:hypothetical protein
MKRELELEWFQQQSTAQSIAIRAMQAMREAKVDPRLVMMTMFEYGYSEPCKSLELSDQMFMYEFIEQFLESGREVLCMEPDERFTEQDF